MRYEDWRDPRIDPVIGDVVQVDLGDGEKERREVTGIERHSCGSIVRCYIDGDTSHARCIRVRDWRELADEMIVMRRGEP